MIEVFSPSGIWHGFLYSINTDKNENTYHIRSMKVPAIRVNTDKATYTFTSVVQEHPKAQSAVVLILKRLRRRDHGFKSHPTDWERPGIEPATPGLQSIGLHTYLF